MYSDKLFETLFIEFGKTTLSLREGGSANLHYPSVNENLDPFFKKILDLTCRDFTYQPFVDMEIEKDILLASDAKEAEIMAMIIFKNSYIKILEADFDYLISISQFYTRVAIYDQLQTMFLPYLNES